MIAELCPGPRRTHGDPHILAINYTGLYIDVESYPHVGPVYGTQTCVIWTYLFLSIFLSDEIEFNFPELQFTRPRTLLKTRYLCRVSALVTL